MASCMFYLHLLNPSFANDLWWAKYSPNGFQALVVDLFNTRLTTHATGSLDLLAPLATMDKSYDAPVATTDVYPTYVRRVLLTELTSIEFAVVNLRSLGTDWSIQMCTQYCWVDLDHEFEIAHTAGRQSRCYNRYMSNGAVYLETMLRNQIWVDFMGSYGGDGGMFTVVIQAWLDQVPAGRAWVATTSNARQSTSLDDEAAYWRAKNVTHFQLQWQNNGQTGVFESILIQNAFGLQQNVVLKSIARTPVTWTTVNLNWLFANDLWTLASMNRSLVRSADNALAQDPHLNLEDVFGLQDSNGDYVAQVELFRVSLGPFLSVDTFYVAIPPPVLAYYDSFQKAIYSTIFASPTFAMNFDAMTRLTVTPVPPAWVNPKFVYYGGSPMCVEGTPTPYVQETFGFYDVCDNQPPLTVFISKYSGIFAAMAMGVSLDILSTCQRTWSQCKATIHTHATLTNDLVALSSFDAKVVRPAMDAIAKLNVSLMQYASHADGTNWTLLTQPLLGDPTWAFYGWSFIYDWVQGTREVVSFQGDISSLVLVSVADLPTLFPSSSNSVTSATWLMYILVVYVTIVLGSIAFGCLVGLIFSRLQVEGTNLFWFNRTVSSVWIGRPLMFVRGVTAVLILSTTQLNLVTSLERSQFQFTPRPWLATMIIAGETTWVLYVVHDVLSLATNRFTIVYGPLSCVFGWLAVICLECMWPIQPQATLNRICAANDMDKAIHCTDGMLQIGSWNRVVVILLILGVSLILAALVGVLYRCVVPDVRGGRLRHVLGVADLYLTSSRSIGGNRLWMMDNVSCLLAGLIPMHYGVKRYTFDVKLWIFRQDGLPANQATSKAFYFHAERIENIPNIPPATTTPSKIYRFSRNAIAFCGMLYPLGAIAGSVSYLRVSQVNLANDMLWASFNVTGAHAFIANWVNEQLALDISATEPFELNINEINHDGSFATATSTVKSSGNYGALLQYSELNSIEATIMGLRETDACIAPWIFTQYCFVDFAQTWEMANSAARQQRCHSMGSNGAVFLEATLRNIPYVTFYSCWGKAFDFAIANELLRSTTGQYWLTSSTLDSKVSIADEMAYWRLHQITSFTTQWQNFKSIGVVNSYSVENALGIHYAFTLQYTNSTFRVAQQTTYKMYWGLANDLYAVAQNDSAIGGLSLVRSSPHFAFANTTMQHVLAQNETLHFPLGRALTIVSNVIGPFGSTDLRFVPCPYEVKHAVRGIFQTVREIIYENSTAQIAFNEINDPQFAMNPVPKAWTDVNFVTVGGSPLCPEVPVRLSPHISLGMVTLMSWQTQCSQTYPLAILLPTVDVMVASVVLGHMNNASTDDIAQTCTQNPQNIDMCVGFLTQTVSFVGLFMAPKMGALAGLTHAATAAVQTLNVEFVQFGQQNQTSPVVLYHINILDPSAPAFAYFAWNFLVDWSLGNREAVSLEGDDGSMTLLTEVHPPVLDQVHLGEDPTSMSVYLQNTVQYITVMIFAITALVLLYLVLSVGHIEVINLARIERVGAIVWVGRPLLFVRSLTGVGLLSTASLELVYNGSISYFEVAQDPWYKTLLAANEVAWMITIANDIALVLTQEYATEVAWFDSTIVLLVTIILSFSVPINHSMSIDKQCSVAQVDAQVVCTSGTIVIGQLSRLTLILALVLGCNVLCYVCSRRCLPRPPPSKINSIFVYAGAKYLFATSRWVHGDVYYMDRMSAVLNGILTLRWKNTMFALDVKLWRTFQVDLTPQFHQLATPLRLALPLVLEPNQQ
ncbi:Aste57867_24475 [Aphanomyces stellatus]|uniref:Aste57867_24475 protein n=1 Tax=Aphanomyces stellatus TaxID=120398 RepID=A0A485LQL3_9STRA|nr:hypothetical protein As57867_024398 [Aphanomyces stellatus]VFU01114.1 Aste57867_24475 [Aphanomyces stellatus]